MGKKVLVVDDEKLIVKGLRFSLEQDDMEVECAYDGEEALEMAKRNKHDLILPDRAGSLPADQGIFGCARHHAHSKRRGHGQNTRTRVWR